MKTGIHPEYGPCTIHCACGNVIETGGTRPRLSVDICSACHPFFTGKQKLVDTAGRIERFQKKYGGKVVTARVAKPKPKAEPKPQSTPQPELQPQPEPQPKAKA